MSKKPSGLIAALAMAAIAHPSAVDRFFDDRGRRPQRSSHEPRLFEIGRYDLRSRGQSLIKTKPRTSKRERRRLRAKAGLA